MAGTVEGGKLAAQKNKERYGEDFYRKIAGMGGRASKGGGFASDKVGKDGLTGKQRAEIAGAKGGKASRKTKHERESD